ncbi:HAD-IC family P-type ATPase [Thioalkalivibrio sp. XN8]|uniref:HAD-IC family P-type ATPase n=1 Tax=Thioalkalivibrio sp. XN8 TaxID=2712863 RepID=UPI0013EDE531|nr:HAD-IC family P-type ATPase [Thioalkalivibrio sp. XN8]NGP54394.1 HAD-IC family P-type ATPase [Thioalkalivibrio sp. XN8]
MPLAPDTAPAWHSLPAADVLAQLAANTAGLAAEEARARLARYGPNRLPEPARRSALRRFLAQCNNVLIWVLLAAATVTGLLGEWTDTGVILGVVLINAIIGFVQEGKAERALEAITELLSPRAMVLRDGRRSELPAEEIVPGDIVLLQAGDLVPADLRLLKCRNLQVDEALLTGESVAAAKSAAPVAPGAGLGDRASMAWSGTLVASGTGTGVVVATAAQTQLGRISAMLARVQTLSTPLTRQLDRFGRKLSLVIGVVALGTMAFGSLVHSYPLDEMFLAAVGLAVAAIPEGLPAIITITLAIGVQRMAARNAIIRQLPAVETLGSVSVICSDKTGTLTRNEMTVGRIVLAGREYHVTGVGYDPHGALRLGDEEPDPAGDAVLMRLCRAAALCNDAEFHARAGGLKLDGDPTEGALLTLALKAGLDPGRLGDALPRDDTIPFESERRYMATLHHDHEGHRVIFAKGAPERILEMCAQVAGADGVAPCRAGEWLERAEALARDGLRVLALATRTPGPESGPELELAEVESGLTLLGLVGLIDPPREEAVTAVARCRSAGIRVKMITGDHLSTARAVGAAMGIGDGSAAVLGADLEGLSDSELRRVAVAADVFARASPEHKLRLVEALQASGRVVAMTGDGVNDAPALKRADVGVAMGRGGTEVSRQAAEMVLSDDNFASIESAVEEGRTVYDNIRKAILFILPTNAAEALMIILAIALGRALPITPLQILWVNMITAVTLALALAFEPPERDIMQRPPRRPDEPLLGRFVTWRIAFVSLLVVTGTFGVFLAARNAGYELETARTMAVNTLVLFEVFYLLTVRHLLAPTLNRNGLFGNRVAVAAVVVVLLFQLGFTYLPTFNTLFGTAPLGRSEWLPLVLVAATVVPLVELEKFLLRRRGAGGGNLTGS